MTTHSWRNLKALVIQKVQNQDNRPIIRKWLVENAPAGRQVFIDLDAVLYPEAFIFLEGLKDVESPDFVE